jgi:hypothetical protein
VLQQIFRLLSANSSLVHQKTVPGIVPRPGLNLKMRESAASVLEEEEEEEFAVCFSLRGPLLN